jgi:transketolase
VSTERLRFVPAAELERVRTLETSPALRATAFAAACRINTLYMIARAGSGHLGTSFSCLDVLSWLFLHELRRPPDVYFSSKGHDAPALYAVLIGLGALPFDGLHALRRLDGLPGHPDVSIPGVEANTGSLGMGISKAKGMAFANRLSGHDGRIVVLTGDGELQEGQIWESLPTAAHRGLGELTVIVDHNRIQSDTWVADVSDLGDLLAKFRAFGWHADRCDGHDPVALARAFADLARVTDRPKVLIADTLKGKGVSFMEPAAMDADERLYAFHSGAPSADVYVKALAELTGAADAALARVGAAPLALADAERPTATVPVSPQRLVTAYSRALVRQAERNPRIVALDADLVKDCGLLAFRARFPERYVQCGIAEQDMVSQAGGMALRGLLPVVHSFACFLSTRPNEQVYNNASERTRIVYVGSLAGLVPAGPGHSHQSVRDVAALGGIPDLLLIEPATEDEVEQALDFCLNRAPGSTYLRLVSIPLDMPFALPAQYRMEPGRGVCLRDGGDVAIVSAGPVTLAEAWRAADLLHAHWGVRAALYDLPWLNHVDRAWLDELARRYPWLVTIDNHYLAGGQGEMLLSALAALPRRPLPRAHRLGLTALPRCGTNAEVLRAHRLDAESLAADIHAALTRSEA